MSAVKPILQAKGLLKRYGTVVAMSGAVADVAAARQCAKFCPKCFKKVCTWYWMQMHSMPFPKIHGCVICCACVPPKNCTQ